MNAWIAEEFVDKQRVKRFFNSRYKIIGASLVMLNEVVGTTK